MSRPVAGAAPLPGAATDPADLIDEAALIVLTCDLVAAAGENPGGTEAATVDVLAAACRQRGLEVELVEIAPGRPNLLATLPPSGPPVPGAGVLFLGHSDVVPAGDGWSGDPFTPLVCEGRIRGRGSADMKGGLAAVVAALDAIARCGMPRPGPLTLACTVDEEDLGLGVRDLVARGLPHPPDAYGGCVVAEPTDLVVVVACRGDAYLRVEVTGVPAHSGRPADGRNAIDAAGEILRIVREDHADLAARPDELLGAASWNAGRIGGGRLTSIVAPECWIDLDRRLLPGEDPEAIAARLAARIDDAGITGDGIGVEVSVTMEMPGFRTPPGHGFVEATLAAARRVGLADRIGGWTAACDGGFVARDLGVPSVVLGPGSVNEQAHQADESVAVAELVAAARLYATLATERARR